MQCEADRLRRTRLPLPSPWCITLPVDLIGMMLPGLPESIKLSHGWLEIMATGAVTCWRILLASRSFAIDLDAAQSAGAPVSDSAKQVYEDLRSLVNGSRSATADPSFADVGVEVCDQAICF